MSEAQAIMFGVFGTPRAQPRPRFVGGRVVSFPDARVKLWRDAIEREAFNVRTAFGLYPRQWPDWCSGPVRIDLDFTFATTDAKRIGLAHTAKPDVDNLGKLVMDCLERVGMLSKGDQRTVELSARKWWAERGSVSIMVRPALAVRQTVEAAAELGDWLR